MFLFNYFSWQFMDKDTKFLLLSSSVNCNCFCSMFAIFTYPICVHIHKNDTLPQKYKTWEIFSESLSRRKALQYLQVQS